MSVVPQVFSIAVTPTIDAGAYASGDTIGAAMTVTSTRLAEIAATGRTPYLIGVSVADKSTQAAVMDVEIYLTVPGGGGSNNAAYDPDDADLVLVAPGSPVHVTDWITNNDNSAGRSGPLAIPCYPADGINLYARAIARAAPTYASTTDLTFTFWFRAV